MATGTAATTAREYHTAQTHYLSKDITFADAATTVNVGYLPAGSFVLRAGVIVRTAFNGDTTNTCSVGVTGTATAFGTTLALGTVGVISGANMATTTKSYSAADIQAIATIVCTANPTTGAGTVFVEYIVVTG